MAIKMIFTGTEESGTEKTEITANIYDYELRIEMIGDSTMFLDKETAVCFLNNLTNQINSMP